jgi:uncharacterized membrane protein YkvA (DUF1232 family)
MKESAELTVPLSRQRAKRFYDRMRESIRRYLTAKGKVASTTGDYLMLAPDVFVLLWRLVNDARVNAKDKVMLGSGLAYYLFPLDIMPEGLMGPIGYIDDLVLGVYLLNRILSDTDPQILRDHWSGNEDVLVTIQKVLNAAESLLGKDVAGRLKK